MTAMNNTTTTTDPDNGQRTHTHNNGEPARHNKLTSVYDRDPCRHTDDGSAWVLEPKHKNSNQSLSTIKRGKNEKRTLHTYSTL